MSAQVSRAPAPQAAQSASDTYDLIAIGEDAAAWTAARAAAVTGARVLLIRKATPGLTEVEQASLRVRFSELARLQHALGARGVAPGTLTRSGALADGLRSARDADPGNASTTHSGVDLLSGPAHFVSRNELSVEGRRLRFERAVIATGRGPAALAAEGFLDGDVLTTDSLATLDSIPRRLVVVGGGGVGCELAQAFARLGSSVTLLERARRVLHDRDPELTEPIATALARDGVRISTSTEVSRLERSATGARVVHYERGFELGSEECDQVLVAIGTAPNIGSLRLEAAMIELDRDGVRVDRQGRTLNPRVSAVGSVRSARTVSDARVIYTDPQLGEVGGHPSATDEAAHVRLTLSRSASSELRPGNVPALIRTHHDRRGRVIGAAVLAADARSTLAELTLLMRAQLTPAALRRAARTASGGELVACLAAELTEHGFPPSLLERLLAVFERHRHE